MFWTFKIEPEEICVIKIRNPIHITDASLCYVDRTADSTVSLYIKHQRQYNQICTFSKAKGNFFYDVELDLKFDSKDDEVEIFFDGLNGIVNLSGSETLPYHISYLNVITMRKLESKDFEHIARYPEKLSNKKAEDWPEDGKIKQIRLSENRDDNVKELCEKFTYLKFPMF